MSKSGFIGVVEKVRLSDLQPPRLIAFIGGVFLLFRRWSYVLFLYVVTASGPLSLSMIVESSCHAKFQCTLYSGWPSAWSIRRMCLVSKPSLVHVSICDCVSISGLHWVTRYEVWLLRCLWYCISRTSYVVCMVSLGVMYASSWCVVRHLLVIPLPKLGWVVIVS
jgi:hypothetical protein